jgi:hypothetical protein
MCSFWWSWPGAAFLILGLGFGVFGQNSVYPTLQQVDFKLMRATRGRAFGTLGG